MRAAVGFVLGALLAAALGLWSLAAASRGAPALEVRSVPWRTQAGRIPRAYPPGQGFRCTREGLERIDVALVTQGADTGEGLELVLRQGSPTGEIVRRARLGPEELPAPGERGWARFEFEPVRYSQHGDFWWQLEVPGERPSCAYTPWVRYHGQPGVDMGWGDRVVPGPVHEGLVADPTSAWGARDTYLRVPHANLSALAFAVDTLRPAVGPCVLELWDEGADPATDPPLRRVELAPEEEVSGGYAWFAFEPVAASRWRAMRYRLTVNRGARLVGTEHGPSFKSWHGRGPSELPLLGASRGERIWTDRAHVFRAFGGAEPADGLDEVTEGLLEVAERAGGWRLGLGGLAWVLSAGLVGALVARRRAPGAR
jgi:hypothetical protein